MNNRKAGRNCAAHRWRAAKSRLCWSNLSPNCRLDEASARKTALGSATLRFAYIFRFSQNVIPLRTRDPVQTSLVVSWILVLGL